MVEDETNGYNTGGVTLPQSENITFCDEEIRELLTSMLIVFGQGGFEFTQWVAFMRAIKHEGAVSYDLDTYSMLRNDDYMELEGGAYYLTDKAIEFINDHNI